MRSCSFSRPSRGRILAGALPILLGLASPCPADTLPEPTAAEQPQAMLLQGYRQVALNQQPTIAATQAALKAATDRACALDNLRVPNCLARDLPVRRQQAALGITVAQAAVAQAQAETVHGVTCSYLGALYAAQQLRLVDTDIRPRLNDLMTLVRDPNIRRRRRDVVLREHENLVRSFLETLDGRVQEGRQGRERALAALREAMGVGPEFVLTLPERDLPCPQVQPQLPELVALALARRGEMAQAATFAQIVCLEIDAQATSGRPNMRTFASGSDIHAKPIPTGDLGGVNFRPALVGPEMPAFLTGSRDARVQQARDYYERAQAVAAKTRNLITLEVEDLYRRWLDQSARAEKLRKAYLQARTFSETVKKSFNQTEREPYPNMDEVINSGLITTRLQLDWKEAHYQSLLALAALERATGGGFAVDFDLAPECETNGNGESNHK